MNLKNIKYLKLEKALTGQKYKLDFFNFMKSIKKKSVRMYFFDNKNGFESTERVNKSNLYILCINGKATIFYNKKKYVLSKKKPLIFCPKGRIFKIKSYKNSNLIFFSDSNY